MTSQRGKQVITAHIILSREVTVTRKRNLVSLWNIIKEIFFFRNYANHAKMWQRDELQTSLCFIKKL